MLQIRLSDVAAFKGCRSDVSKLKQLTQEKFVDMYNDDNPLEAVKKYITNNNCDIEVPKLGDLDIDKVLGSRNFFS